MIIPVLDIRDGIVVHAIAGKREHYRPIVSTLTDSTNPNVVADALFHATGSPILYVADLDAIEKRRPFKSLKPASFQKIWLDIGIRTVINPTFFDSRYSLVVGTETLTDDAVAIEMLTRLGPERVVLSIDLFPGQERRYDSLLNAWQDAGGRDVIWLNLAAVGTGRNDLSAYITTHILNYPRLLHYPGGGVRTNADIDSWFTAGATGVLVASALHNGTVKRTL